MQVVQYIHTKAFKPTRQLHHCKLCHVLYYSGQVLIILLGIYFDFPLRFSGVSYRDFIVVCLRHDGLIPLPPPGVGGEGVLANSLNKTVSVKNSQLLAHASKFGPSSNVRVPNVDLIIDHNLLSNSVSIFLSAIFVSCA